MNHYNHVNDTYNAPSLAAHPTASLSMYCITCLLSDDLSCLSHMGIMRTSYLTAHGVPFVV